MHFIKNYSLLRCEAIGTIADKLMAFLHVWVSAMILLGMQTANAQPVATTTIVRPKAGVTDNGSFSGVVDGTVVALETKSEASQFTLTMNTVSSGSAAFDPPGGTYDASTVNQVMLEEIKTGTSTESVTVTTSANLIAVSGHLYLAAISTKARVHLDGVSGLGLTWTLVKKQCAGRGSTSVELWMAMGTPNGNGPVTATFPAAPSNAVITVVRYSGVYGDDPIGNVVSFSANGEDGPCTGGVDADNYSFNLATTTNDAVVYTAVALRSRTHTPGAGYTERAEISQGTPNAAAGIAVMDKKIVSVSNVAVNGALNGITDWSAVAVEIKAQTGVTTVIDEHSASPFDFQLGQNYPNPFSSAARSPAVSGRNPGTQINFSLPASGKVILDIYNETGQLVRTLVEGEMATGPHSVRWNGLNQLGTAMAAGIYLYRVVVRGKTGEIVFAQTRRMTLLK
ncbi:MAG: FlgD immunoglobulin-like domain containing protein [bacterium]